MTVSEEASELDIILQALAHPVRRRVIELLAENQGLSYSELMRLVGVEDSGTFGFHLRRLRGLVRKNERGDYELTELGLRAYKLLRLLRSRTELVPDKPLIEETSHDVISLGGVRELEVTRSLLERFVQGNKSLEISDVERLVVHPVEPELFTRAVKRINNIGIVYAPSSLRDVLESRITYARELVYYSDEEELQELLGKPRESKGILSKVLGLVKASKKSNEIPPRTIMRGRVRLNGKRLVLVADTCTVSLGTSSSRSELEYHYSVRARDPGLKVEKENNGTKITCMPRKPRWAELSIGAPITPLEEASIVLDTSEAELSELVTNRAKLFADTSEARFGLRLVGDNPVAEIETDTSELEGLVSGEWRGNALIRIKADTSSMELRLRIPSDAAIAVAPEMLDTSEISITLNGITVPLFYADQGYDKAARRIRLLISADTSEVRIDIRRAKES